MNLLNCLNDSNLQEHLLCDHEATRDWQEVEYQLCRARVRCDGVENLHR